jgi:hypothetical protein
MPTDYLSLVLCVAVAACSNRLMPFILCLVVLAKTGKTNGFRDVAAVFGSSHSDLRGAAPSEPTKRRQKRPVRRSALP